MSILKTQIAAAIGCARGNALDEIMREVWIRFGAGQLAEDEAGQLSSLAQERRNALRGGSVQIGLGLVLPPPWKRCPTPVRRHSHLRGRSEGRIWRPTTCKDVQAILKAAEIYNEAGLRVKGERSGPLGSVALDVLRMFVHLIDFRTGRLEPSIRTIMERLGRSRDAIVRALKNLRAHGFLDWLRRYEPTGNEGRGPQVRQTSNAYRLSLPEKARQLLGRFGKAPPLPDDHSAAQAERAAELDAYRKSLPLGERALFDAGDTALGRALAALERESDTQAASLSYSYSLCESGRSYGPAAGPTRV